LQNRARYGEEEKSIQKEGGVAPATKSNPPINRYLDAASQPPEKEPRGNGQCFGSLYKGRKANSASDGQGVSPADLTSAHRKKKEKDGRVEPPRESH